MSTHPERIGAYPIEREVGRGGMGVVYLGRDPKLDRPVAIKVLPAAFASDPERLARFEREAKLLASLNHPNIASIYGIEEDDGQRFLVLEYVEGETLGERIDAGPLPIDEAMDVCRQIAAALEAAHESGVIHRDLKPGNVKLTPGGEVKVLDFGLAKGPAGTADSNPDLSQSPTMTVGATGVGVILGTAGYMSPEQARGRAVDRRTDIWSFGCVLHECLTGRQTFGGETVSDTIAKILQGEPDMSILPGKTPDRVRHLLGRCLEKDPRKRLRDIGDARIELDDAHESMTSTVRAAVQPEVAAAASRSSMWRGLAIGAIAGVLLAVGLMTFMRPPADGPRSTPRGARLSIPVPPDIQLFTLGLEMGAPIDLAPDGSAILILASPVEGEDRNLQRIYKRMLDGTTFEPIPGTDFARSRPRVTPDGRHIYFLAGVARGASDEEVRRIPIDGSAPPVKVCAMSEDWDGAFLVLPDGGLLFVHLDGKRFTRVSTNGEAGSPIEIQVDGFDGTFDLNFLGREAVLNDDAVFMGTTYFDETGWGKGVAEVNPNTGEGRIVLKDAGHAKLDGAGNIIFTRGDVLLAAKYDAGAAQVAGDPRALFDDVRTFGRFVAGRFEMSESGLLAFPPGGRIAENRAMATVTVDGRSEEWADSHKAYNWNWIPWATYDGEYAVMVATNARGVDEVWMSNVERPFFRRLVAFDDADAGAPVLSRDHQWLAFRVVGGDERDGLYVRRVDEPGTGVRVHEHEEGATGLPVAWLPDGRGFTFVVRSGVGRDIYMIRYADGPGSEFEKVPLVVDAFDNRGGSLSPDGRWMSFTSNRSGRTQIYVAPFTANGIGAAVPVTRSGASARFQGASRIAYIDSFEVLKRIHLEFGATARVVREERLFNLADKRIAEWAPLPDGRFIAIKEGGEEFKVSSIEVLLDWRGRLDEVLTD